MRLNRIIAASLVCLAASSAWAQSSTGGGGDAVMKDQPSASGLSSTESKANRDRTDSPDARRAGRATPDGSPYVTPPQSEK